MTHSPDWAALIARVHAGERAKDVAREHGLSGRVLWMKALHADPSFAAAHRERSRERMKALNADPSFAAASRERMKALHAEPGFNPLVALSEQERADYDVLKKNGYTRAEAFRAIGRAELAERRRSPAE